MFELEKSKKIGLAMSLALSMFSVSNVSASENCNATKKEAQTVCKSETCNENVQFNIDCKGTLKGYKGSAKEVVIPENVKAIASGVFMNNPDIEKVYFPEGLERIGQYAFYSCSSLKEIVLPDSVKRLGKLAFADCKNCSKVYLGKNIFDLGEVGFLGCSSLKSIDVSKDNENFVSYNGMLFNKDCSALKVCPAGYGTDVKLPECTKLISCYAFLSCKNIERVQRLGTNPIEIQDTAFYGCENLKELDMSDCITSIGSCAFTQCTSLKEFNIGKNVEYIGSAAFMGCSSLKRVNCFSPKLSIGRNLFASCPQTILVSAPEDSELGKYVLKHSNKLALI